MRLMVSEFKPLVMLLFPLVSLGGMLQLHTMWKISHAVTSAIPEPTVLQLFMASMIYPLFLAAFFRLDGAKLSFQLATIIFISAILGLVVYPILAAPMSLVGPTLTASPWFGLTVLLIDVALAVGFLTILSETDFHKLSGAWILGSLTSFECMAVVMVLYGTGTLHRWYVLAAAKATAVARLVM